MVTRSASTSRPPNVCVRARAGESASPLDRFDDAGVLVGGDALCLRCLANPRRAVPREGFEEPDGGADLGVEVAAADQDLVAANEQSDAARRIVRGALHPCVRDSDDIAALAPELEHWAAIADAAEEPEAAEVLVRVDFYTGSVVGLAGAASNALQDATIHGRARFSRGRRRGLRV